MPEVRQVCASLVFARGYRWGLHYAIDVCNNEPMRTNQYPGTCAKCGQTVGTTLGIAYRRPNNAKWFVRCGDEQECGTRVADIKAAESDRSNERHLASDQHAKAVVVASGYHLPKTVSYERDNGASVTFARRRTSRGCNVTVTRNDGNGVVRVERWAMTTEEDAVAAVVSELRHAANPTFGPPSKSAAAVLAEVTRG